MVVSPGRSGHLLPALCAAGAAFFWATNFVIGAGVVDAVPPASLVFLRWALAAVPLLVIAQVVERPDWSVVRTDWRSQLRLSAAGFVVGPLFIYLALQHTSAFNASFVGSVSPIFIALAAAVVLGERLTARVGIGAVLASVGVVGVLFGSPVAPGLSGVGVGELWMVGNVAMWVVYTLLGRVATPEVPPITATAVQATIAAALSLPLTALDGGPVLPQTASQWWSVIGIAVFPSLLAYLLWTRAARDLEAGAMGAFLALNPLVVAVFTVAMGQDLGVWQVIGGALIIAGVLMANGVSLPGRRSGGRR